MWEEHGYRVVSEPSSPLGLDGECVGHAYMSIAYVFFMFVDYGLLCIHGGGHCFHFVSMWELMMLLLDVFFMIACWLYINSLCMLVSICQGHQ